jgi:8-oxo-dGTP pyrophosphatase MutT (NUDIX family)/GTPase SAR1 family protein
MIVFISGLSGTGKSTLVEYFKNHPIDSWLFYDYDKGEFPVPDYESEHLEWRKKQSEYWLQVALENKKNNIDTCVLGMALYPENTFELVSAAKLKNNISFALIDCSDEERKKRLFDRGTPQHWQGEKDFYTEFRRVNSEHCGQTFDTTNKKVEETAQEIKNWLESLSNDLFINLSQKLIKKPKDREVEKRISVYGIIIEKGKILIAKVRDSIFWDLPGGGQKKGENDFDNLKREMLEEANCRISALGDFVAEDKSNFYADDLDTYFHNTGRYYMIDKYEFVEKPLEAEMEEFNFVDLNEIGRVNLRTDHKEIIEKYILKR